ncbi:MAG: hypothetical protein V1838_01335 [Patescibacteria group bacterium]
MNRLAEMVRDVGCDKGVKDSFRVIFRQRDGDNVIIISARYYGLDDAGWAIRAERINDIFKIAREEAPEARSQTSMVWKTCQLSPGNDPGEILKFDQFIIKMPWGIFFSSFYEMMGEELVSKRGTQDDIIEL